MNNQIPTALELRRQYDAEGYCVARNVLDRGLIQEASDHIDWLLKNNPGLRPEQLHNDLIQEDAFWVRLISDDRLLDVAEQFIGPNIALFASHYISKRPFDGQVVLWHQDASYWPLEPMQVLSLWLAVDDATPENGCLRVIPGTQTLPVQPNRKRDDVSNVLGSEMDLAMVDESKAVDVCLNAGDVELHHSHLIHGSNANTSPRRRAGLTIRYIPTTTRILTKKQWPSAFLLRGEAVAGVNQYLPYPKCEEGKSMRFNGWEEWNSSVAGRMIKGTEQLSASR